MRIIGGEFRGRRLQAPKGSDTRPMRDSVRQALFNVLDPDLEGARCADLFAGTGALGFEALSRGARHCVFLDLDGAALACLGANARALRCEDRAAIVRADACRRMAMWRAEATRFDLIFCAPPYRWYEDHEESLAGIWRDCAAGVLAQDGILVLDMPVSATPSPPPALEMVWSRDYATTRLCCWCWRDRVAPADDEAG